MKNAATVTCADCYFRREGLCAITTDAPCPTFRAHTRGALAPPRQPRLVPRSLAALVEHHVAA